MTDRRHPAGRAVAGIGLLVVLLALAVGCGRTDQQIEARAPAAGADRAAAPAGPAGPTLPTLPPAEQRAPDRYDARGCLETGPTSVDCGERAGQVDAAAAGRVETDWRTLAGFVGRHYTTDTSRNAVVVLERTVWTGPDGTGRWSARGLARNEQPVVVAGVEVEATLLAADGSVLEVVRQPSPVDAVRPGEPVPFTVGSSTPAASVASVRWGAVTTPGAADASRRELELATYWTRGFGEPRPVSFYLHQDPPSGPTPFLLFGSARNHGALLARPHVTVAWMGADGTVLAVRDTPLVEPSGSPAVALATGGAWDFLVVVDDATVGPALADATPMLWGGGR